MTGFQVLIGLMLTMCMVLRPFLYKPAAVFFNLNISSLFTSIWLVVGLMVTFPLLGHLFTDNIADIIHSPYVWLSVIKGICLWMAVKISQSINRESTSSSTFYLFGALALSSLINNLCFNEGLKIYQLLCIVCLGIVGFCFFIYGDAKRLSRKNKIAFLLAVMFWSFFNVEDHLAISHIGWYPHLLISSVVMFLACFLNKVTINDIKTVFKNKNIIVAGIFYSATEFLIIYSMINVMPVSFACLFMRMAIPIVMIVSAIRYKEQNIRNQLVLGLISLVLILPLILIK